MDPLATPTAALSELGEEIRRAGTHRNLRFKVVVADDGQQLVVVSNRTAAAAYRLQPGWTGQLRSNVEGGLFG